jgi:hypothetical protein
MSQGSMVQVQGAIKNENSSIIEERQKQRGRMSFCMHHTSGPISLKSIPSSAQKSDFSKYFI